MVNWAHINYLVFKKINMKKKSSHKIIYLFITSDDVENAKVNELTFSLNLGWDVS